jgi:N-acetylmuramoyl-L-alanine amidase
MRCTINAGHCPGLDSGAVGQTGLQEANVAKDISLLVCKYLNNVGYQTQFVQDNELQNICDISNVFESDLFVSIHCNAAESREAQGTETFCMAEDSAGGRLARCIQSQVVNSLGTVDRGVKVGSGLYVIKHTDCTAVLVETAFISNPEDEALLLDDSKIDQFASAIARGITDYVGGM